MSDADGSIPAGEMPKILAPVLSGQVDVCIGSRHMEDSSANVSPPPWRRIWSEISNLVVRATLLPGIKDTQCGFKAFSGEAAEAVFSQAQIDGWAFDLEALSLARRFGFLIKEVGVHWSDDKRSRVDPAQDFLRVVREWSRIRRNLRHGVYCFAESEL